MTGKSTANPRRINGDHSGVQRDLPVGAGGSGGRFFRAAAGAPGIQPPATGLPVWLAALMAVDCQAHTKEEDRLVLWNCVAGRAVYTNCGAELEVIEPLGVQLQGGDTLAVSWAPGDTSYRVEVLGRLN